MLQYETDLFVRLPNCFMTLHMKSYPLPTVTEYNEPYQSTTYLQNTRSDIIQNTIQMHNMNVLQDIQWHKY